MPDAGASRKRQISGRPISRPSKAPGRDRSQPAPLEPWQQWGRLAVGPPQSNTDQAVPPAARCLHEIHRIVLNHID